MRGALPIALKAASLLAGLAALAPLIASAVGGDASASTERGPVSPPPAPMWVGLANGAGDARAYVNAANERDLSLVVGVPAGSSSEDTVTATLSDGTATTAARTARATSGAGTVTISGIDASRLSEGRVTLRGTSSNASGTSSTSQAFVAKDTRAPVSRADAPPSLVSGTAVIVPYGVTETGSGLSKVELYVDPPAGGPNSVLALTDMAPAIVGRSFSYTDATADAAYGFYTRAYDRAGNVEGAKETADSTTVRDTAGQGSPRSVFAVSPGSTYGGPVGRAL